MSAHDEDYFRARAIEERQAAADAPQSEAALIHEKLARHYEALVRQPDLGRARKAA